FPPRGKPSAGRLHARFNAVLPLPDLLQYLFNLPHAFTLAIDRCVKYTVNHESLLAKAKNPRYD
ncbi:MAG: hypothetical protein QM271_10540, partial [Bacillota bacterium]|nr:hypothetical protein [Bacillota bacterium]